MLKRPCCRRCSRDIRRSPSGLSCSSSARVLLLDGAVSEASKEDSVTRTDVVITVNPNPSFFAMGCRHCSSGPGPRLHITQHTLYHGDSRRCKGVVLTGTRTYGLGLPRLCAPPPPTFVAVRPSATGVEGRGKDLGLVCSSGWVWT